MRKTLVVAAIFTLLGTLLGLHLRSDPPVLLAAGAGGAGECASQNGDVNADGKIDLGDAITILGHLFLGGPAELLPVCASPPAGPALPATGQTRCYDAKGLEIPCDPVVCPGQDAAYGLGRPMEGRFIDQGDDAVLDSFTGLIWKKKSEAEGMSWCEALAFCEKLSFAGLDDWRLPNVHELQSLIHYGRSGPPLDPLFLPGTGTPGHWTSTALAGDATQAWSVAFGGGNAAGIIIPGWTGNKFTVRAVRTAP